jgi:hypothetical protein
LEVKKVLAKSEVASANINSRWAKSSTKSKGDGYGRNTDGILVNSYKLDTSSTVISSSLRSEHNNLRALSDPADQTCDDPEFEFEDCEEPENPRPDPECPRKSKMDSPESPSLGNPNGGSGDAANGSHGLFNSILGAIEKQKKSPYTPEFEVLWRDWCSDKRRNANESKLAAFNGFRRLARADRQNLRLGLAEYRKWFDAEEARRKGRDPPIYIHLSTFISKRRWESLIEGKSEEKNSSIVLHKDKNPTEWQLWLNYYKRNGQKFMANTMQNEFTLTVTVPSMLPEFSEAQNVV